MTFISNMKVVQLSQWKLSANWFVQKLFNLAGRLELGKIVASSIISTGDELIR